MKGLSSIHNHTVFCDGRDGVEEMCAAALEKGLASVGISAHAPVGKAGLRTDWHLRDERLGEYLGEVRAARLRWEGRIEVYAGLELDYIRGMRSARDADIEEMLGGGSLDFVIGAAHYVSSPRGGPFAVFAVDEPLAQMEKEMRAGFGGSGEAMMHAYWDAVVEMAELGGIDAVAHLDLVKKHNGKARWFDEDGAAYLRRADEAAAAIARAGLVVEANTGGMNRGYLSEPFPSPAILRILRRREVPIMISADAHRASDVAGHYAEALEFLRAAGYSSHVAFGGRSAGSPVWREILI